ncbi:hypothetical protein CMEL01_05693, partial [Colletotrichum melonis]
VSESVLIFSPNNGEGGEGCFPKSKAVNGAVRSSIQVSQLCFSFVRALPSSVMTLPGIKTRQSRHMPGSSRSGRQPRCSLLTERRDMERNEGCGWEEAADRGSKKPERSLFLTKSSVSIRRRKEEGN